MKVGPFVRWLDELIGSCLLVGVKMQQVLTTCTVRYHTVLWGSRSTGQL